MPMDLHCTTPPDAAPTVIKVKYRKLNEYYVFTSDQVSGLYVCSKNPETAVGEICEAVELLKWINDSVECKVRLTQDFYDFIAHERAANALASCVKDEFSLIMDKAA